MACRHLDEDERDELNRLRDLQLRLNAGEGNEEAKGGERYYQRLILLTLSLCYSLMVSYQSKLNLNES